MMKRRKKNFAVRTFCGLTAVYDWAGQSEWAGEGAWPAAGESASFSVFLNTHYKMASAQRRQSKKF